MSRTQISIKLEASLLDRVDQLAEEDGVTRTAVIERAIRQNLPRQEEFNKSLENPLVRAVHEQLSRPAVLKIIAKLANEELTDEHLEWAMSEGPKVRQAAKERRRTRKNQKQEGS